MALVSTLLIMILAPNLGVSFFSFFWTVFLVFLTLGSLLELFVSFIIDHKRFRNPIYRYIASVFLYIYGGILILASLSMVIEKLSPIDLTLLLTLGVLPAWVYYHVKLIVRRILSN
ncbi:hypothetical protein [Alkalibacillus silvisoli]|uniref:Uncharacterized protein n=1 Tax=Alkalibacillus silvisoli TaxID=392823 RepID=A0ABN0ZNX2_9BACI